MKANRYVIYPPIIFAVLVTVIYIGLFYPNQQVSVRQVERIVVNTPTPEVYHNDCLHPCIRYSGKGFAGYHYWMVQSPYYGWNNKVENPIIYRSNCLDSIGADGLVLTETPLTGFNSDPNLYIDGDSVLYVFWRECGTPLCAELARSPVTVGVSTRDGVHFSEKQIYLVNDWATGDTEQAPVLMRHNGEYWFYAAWYQYEPERKNKGVTIWKGTSLSSPDFVLTDTVPFEDIYVCDKAAELRVDGYRLYLPKPQKFDLWHFDLWEDSNGYLKMIACAEKGDVVMLGESEDWLHFKMQRTPLVMNHYMQNYVDYRQYYYKPTACIDNDGTHYFWTSGSKEDGKRNVLWHTCVKH